MYLRAEVDFPKGMYHMLQGEQLAEDLIIKTYLMNYKKKDLFNAIIMHIQFSPKPLKKCRTRVVKELYYHLKPFLLLLQKGF